MTEDSYIVADAGPPVCATHTDLDAALADPRVTDTLDRLVRRYSGGSVGADDLRQQVLVQVIEHVRSNYDCEQAPLVPYILACLQRHALWARRRLLGWRGPSEGGERSTALSPTGDIEALADAHRWADGDRAMAASAALLRVSEQLPKLSAEQLRHLALRAVAGVGPKQAAAELGVSERWERRQWSNIQRILLAGRERPHE